MKQPLLVLMLMMSVLCTGATSCDKSEDIRTENNNGEENMTTNKITVKVGQKTFTATLLDNSSAKAFKKLLPMTINMVELNGNEKYYDLSGSLPTNSSNVGTIQNGELMLYGSKTLVLFYKSFSTSYSYSRLGRLDDVSGLAEALGSGSISVKFELAN
ncbi:hypothetical protein GCM10009120_43020 [Sphingobacterium siyangense subsp. cladoniae]|uniref:cyclophilin-like fold protein n=1 Tax=Sphingobacterium siyangense TaxID=459529 RepID=UPI0031F9C942